MRWDRFFEDLEDQLDSEWEAERVALDSEAERLRLSRLPLRERLRALAADPAPPLSLTLADDRTLACRLTAVGVDWIGCTLLAGSARPELRAGHGAGAVIVPAEAIRELGMPEAERCASARGDGIPTRAGLSERMTLGFVLRDIARRRAAVTLQPAGRTHPHRDDRPRAGRSPRPGRARPR
ncbi:hypothetical protein [Microbacterium elymi]|uniref:DUF222 domain-containing protein n=1 Tax=Microbacterium elymi TaxID=2909587 RepID=A0ABY5NKU5_9MICO|nr:hypothetical protein [Microbacterium elymi]UUT35696.1 hypothetical protein L2X98_20890 [Microbacterium elymi]